MSRDGEGPLWVCFCCGCVGPIVLVKQALVAGPFFVLVFGTIMSMATYFFIRGVPLMFLMILNNKTIGPVVKFLFIIALPLPIAVYFPIMIIGCTCLSLYATVVVPVVVTNDTDYHVLGGWKQMFTLLFQPFEGFWREGRGALEGLREQRNEKLDPGEVACEIRLHELFMIVVLWLVSITVVWPFWILDATLKFVPVTGRLIYQLWKNYAEKYGDNHPLFHCCCVPGFIVLSCLVPVFSVLVYVFLILMGLAVSSYSVVVYWQTESVRIALSYMLCCMHEFDRQSSKFIRDPDSYDTDGCSCCSPCVNAFDCCTITSEHSVFHPEAMEYARDMIKIMT